jgi:hypothetical protein
MGRNTQSATPTRSIVVTSSYPTDNIKKPVGNSVTVRGFQIFCFTVKELMGHSTIQMTERYSHLAPEHKASAVEKLVTF